MTPEALLGVARYLTDRSAARLVRTSMSSSAVRSEPFSAATDIADRESRVDDAGSFFDWDDADAFMHRCSEEEDERLYVQRPRPVNKPPELLRRPWTLAAVRGGPRATGYIEESLCRRRLDRGGPRATGYIPPRT